MRKTKLQAKGMKICVMGTGFARDIVVWLALQGEEVIYKEDEVKIDYMRAEKPDFLISYNYPYVIPAEIINFVKNRAINLHISYLPWNRGSYPNVWSFLENTPKGVSIIRVDKTVDTGDIIARKKVFFNENEETLASSYERLHREMQRLLKKNWHNIKNWKIRPQRQRGTGSLHLVREYETIIKPLIKEKKWDTPVKELKKKYEEWKHSGSKKVKPA